MSILLKPITFTCSTIFKIKLFIINLSVCISTFDRKKAKQEKKKNKKK